MQAARALAHLSRVRPLALRDVSWRTWVDGVATHPDVRELLDAFARLATFVAAPERASAGATIQQIRLAADPGVLYLHEGWQSLVDQLGKARARA